MTEFRREARPDAGLPPDAKHDLDALRDATARELPSLERSLVLARSRRETAEPREEWWISMVNPMRKHPWWAATGVAAVVVLAMLVIPVSYEKTSSHDVTLKLSQVSDVKQVEAIAAELRTALGAAGVQVKQTLEDGVPVFALDVSAPGNGAAERARAFGQELIDRGYQASWTVVPRTERVWGTMYAYARDRVIRVDIDGKSAQQIQEEIRRQLAASGITGARVSVEESGDGGHQVTVRAEADHSPGQPAADELELQLTKDGQPLAAEGSKVQVKKLKDASGALRMVLDLTSSGRTTRIEIANVDTKGDAAVAAEINAALAQAGLADLVAEVQGDQITVRRR